MWECHLHKCPHSGHNTQIHSNYPTFTNCTNSANIPHGSGKVKYRRRWQKDSFMFRMSTCHFNPLRLNLFFKLPQQLSDYLCKALIDDSSFRAIDAATRAHTTTSDLLLYVLQLPYTKKTIETFQAGILRRHLATTSLQTDRTGQRGSIV